VLSVGRVVLHRRVPSDSGESDGEPRASYLNLRGTVGIQSLAALDNLHEAGGALAGGGAESNSTIGGVGGRAAGTHTRTHTFAPHRAAEPALGTHKHALRSGTRWSSQGAF